jgi:archaeal flagellar protein FlaJ
MKFKIPFSFGSLDKQKKRAAYFQTFVKYKKKSALEDFLRNSDAGVNREEYLAICIFGFFIILSISFVISTTVLFFLGIANTILVSLAIAFGLSTFVFILRIIYPKVYSNRRQRDIEKNIIPALSDMLVQLTSGIPLFTIMINLSSESYSSLSDEFKKAVKRINAGLPQVDVLEELGEQNPSIYFRRALWQISNGMRAGSDITVVIKDTIKSLNEEQFIQIQNYGNKLNPMIMFYMLSSVILPALGVTFLTVITSLVSVPQQTTQFFFLMLFFFVIFVQIMFLGVIRSLRPSLL